MRTVLDRDLLKTVLSESGMTQKELAERMGYEDQSAVSQLVNRKRCSLDKTVSALEKMGCVLIVRRRGADVFEVRTNWVVGKES